MLRALAVLGAALAGAYMIAGGQVAGMNLFDAPVALLAFAVAGGAAVFALRYI